VPALDNVRLTLVETFDEACALREWAARQPYLAVDTEGTGFYPDVDHTRMVQFGNTEEGWAVSVETRGWGALCHEILTDHRGSLVAHNAKFDAAMIRKDLGYSFPLHRVHDTMIMHHTLHPHRRSGLKSVADRLIDPTASVGQEALKDDFKAYKWDWATVPTNHPNYWYYSALDTVLTARVFELLYPEIMSEAPKAYDLEMATAWLTEKVERRGAMVDREYAQENLGNFHHQSSIIRQQINDQYDIEPGSSKGIVEVLQSAGHHFTKFTPGGAIALDKEVLDAIEHPLVTLIRRYRTYEKLSSTYLENFLSLTSDGHPFLHPSINSLGFSETGSGFGVKTSRMSMSNPNLQNLPKANKRDPEAPAQIIRNCIRARDGHTLIFCDFSQIEMRLLAHYSNDQHLIDAFSQGDFFVNLARQIFQDPTLALDDPRRNQTKTIGYAEIYGAGLEKLASQLKMSTAHTAEFKQAWSSMYPGIRAFNQKTQADAFANKKRYGDVPFVRSDLTNRRYIVPEGKEYALVNRRLQGAAAEIFKMKILELQACDLDRYMILFVHDEVILDVPNEDVRDVVHVLQQVMNDDKLLRVPITAEISYGPRWGQKKSWTEET
jgi:DNA polymerase I